MPNMFPIMTLGELREKLKDLPDDTIIVGEFEEEFRFNEIGEIKILPAGEYAVTLDDAATRVHKMTPTVILYGGQIVNAEYALDDRLDQYIDHPPEG